MARLKTISDLGPEHTRLSSRAAARLAREMRKAGWPVSQAMLYRSTPHKVARKIAPKTDPDAPARIAVQIARLAGFLPAEDKS